MHLIASSPACILSFIITALVRGEFADAWNWSDEPEKPEKSAAEVAALEDAKPLENGKSKPSNDSLEVPNVEEDKSETDNDGSEAESKPKKRRSKKKAT